MSNLVCGIGINDSDYRVHYRKAHGCDIFRIWVAMLRNIGRPDSNMNNRICKEWESFMQFREWHLKQDYVEGQVLIRALHDPFSDIYSPESSGYGSKELSRLLNVRLNGGTYLPPGCCFKRKDAFWPNLSSEKNVSTKDKYSPRLSSQEYNRALSSRILELLLSDNEGESAKVGIRTYLERLANMTAKTINIKVELNEIDNEQLHSSIGMFLRSRISRVKYGNGLRNMLSKILPELRKGYVVYDFYRTDSKHINLTLAKLNYRNGV